MPEEMNFERANGSGTHLLGEQAQAQSESSLDAEMFFDDHISPDPQEINFSSRVNHASEDRLVHNNAQHFSKINEALIQHEECFDRLTNALCSLKMQMDNVQHMLKASKNEVSVSLDTSAQIQAKTIRPATKQIIAAPVSMQQTTPKVSDAQLKYPQGGPTACNIANVHQTYAEAVAKPKVDEIDWSLMANGNIAGMIPTFQNEKNDTYEAERFISAIRALAEEHRLGPVGIRYLLESKLGTKAREIYFDGLGMEDFMPIQERLEEFINLFTKAPVNFQQHDLFHNCVQQPQERVTQFLLRMKGLLAKTKGSLWHTPEERNNLLINQLRKGLHETLAWELSRADLHTYDESAAYVLKAEQNFRRGSRYPTRINVVQSNGSNLKYNWQSPIKVWSAKTNSEPRQVHQRNNTLCYSCKQNGHIARNCQNQPATRDFRVICARCQKNGHRESQCKVVLPPHTSDFSKRECSTLEAREWGAGLNTNQTGLNTKVTFNQNKVSSSNKYKSKKKSHFSKFRGSRSKKQKRINPLGQTNHVTSSQSQHTPGNPNASVSFATHNPYEIMTSPGFVQYDITNNAESHDSRDKNEMSTRKVKMEDTKQRKSQNNVSKANKSRFNNKNKKNKFTKHNSSNNSNQTNLISPEIAIINKTSSTLQYDKLVRDKPIIKVRIFDKTILGLLDTGAEMTVLDEQYMTGSKRISRLRQVRLSSPISKLNLDGYKTVINISIDNIQFLQPVCVCKLHSTKDYQMIIGMDLLQTHNAIINTENKTVKFDFNTSNDWNAWVATLENVATVQCELMEPDHMVPVQGELIEPDDQIYQDALVLGEHSMEEKNLLGDNVGKVDFEEICNLLRVKEIEINEQQLNRLSQIIKLNQIILIEDVTQMTGASIPPYAPKFNSDTPIYQKQYRFPQSVYSPLRKKLNELETAGIVKRQSSQWNSPVLVVKKRDSEDVRMVIDLRKLNTIIEPERYPLMRIDDILDRLGGSKVFSNLDLNNGYYNVKLDESIQERFGFQTPWSKYILTRLPQGCAVSPSVFQDIMNRCLHNIPHYDKVFCFQDDVIIHTETVEEHLIVLSEVLEAFRNINMAVRPSKCKLFCKTLKFLGHTIDKDGSHPTDANINNVKDFPRPNSIRGIRRFLGTINFYRKFIQGFTEIAAPLYSLLKKKNVKVNWSPEADQAFELLKEKLISAPVLAYPDFTKPFIIKSDASLCAVGGVLEQENSEGFPQPISFCSRKLSKAESNYSAIEREALAIVYNLQQFKHLTYGHTVILKTDHRPLTYIFELKENNLRLIRWFLLIQDHNLKFEYIPGKLNTVADWLSRRHDRDDVLPEVNVIESNQLPITFDRVLKGQNDDPDCKVLIDNVNKNFYKSKEYILDENNLLLKHIIPHHSRDRQYRVVVPKALIADIIYNYHDRIQGGHLAFHHTISKIQQMFTWDSMSKDINHYIASCTKCQQHRMHRTKAPLQPVVAPTYPLERLSADVLGPFSTTRNRNKYMIVWTDHLTRMSWASAIPNQEAKTIARDYMLNIFAKYGGSREIITDRGGNFTSTIFTELCKRLDIKKINTTAYHARANGTSERVNSKILRVLAHFCNTTYTNWDEVLPYVMQTLNNSIHRSTNETPFYLFHGYDQLDPGVEIRNSRAEYGHGTEEMVEELTNRMQIARSIVHDNLTKASVVSCKARDHKSKLREFRVGESVWVLDPTSFTGKNRKLKPRFKGPFKVIQKYGIVNYKVRNLAAPHEVKNVHIDKLKKFVNRMVLDDVEPGDAPENKLSFNYTTCRECELDISDHVIPLPPQALPTGKHKNTEGSVASPVAPADSKNGETNRENRKDDQDTKNTSQPSLIEDKTSQNSNETSSPPPVSKVARSQSPYFLRSKSKLNV